MITHTMPAFQAVCFSTNSSKEIERGYDISDLQHRLQHKMVNAVSKPVSVIGFVECAGLD